MSYTQAKTDIENALFDMFQSILGNDRIFFERTDFVRPDEDYVTIRVANVRPLEREGIIRGGNPEDPEITYLNYEVVVDIKTYRGDALATAMTLRHSLSMNELRENFLNSQNIGYLRSDPIDDTSIVLDDEKWENRAAFFSVFHVILTLPDSFDTNGAVVTVITDETVNAEEDTITNSSTITYP